MKAPNIHIPQTDREAKRFFSNSNLHKLQIREDRENVITAIDAAAHKFPFHAIKSQAMTLGGVNRQAVKDAISIELPHRESYYQLMMKNLGQLREFFPDDELREVVLIYVEKYPFLTYCAREDLEKIFSSDYFNSRVDELFEVEPLKHIFLLLRSYARLEAFSERIREKIMTRLSDDPVDVEIAQPREAGFACGGLEDNFRGALYTNQGLIKVNNLGLAKLHHRKRTDAELLGDGLKISYIFPENQPTIYGAMVLRNFAYTSTGEDHIKIAEAIKEGAKNIELPNWRVRPVRPTIKMNTTEVIAEFDSNNS